MTLATRLKQKINKTGPISVATYMEMCNEAYYAHTIPMSAEGDFITAPEISSLFGEMLALWCLDILRKFPHASFLNLVELGPGTGQLMADILRTFQVLQPDLPIRITLIEKSPKLTQHQKKRLAGFANITSQSCLEDMLRDAPQDDRACWIYLGNEFLDALPIHQYVRKKGLWFERQIGLKEDQFIFTLAKTPVSLPFSTHSREISHNIAEGTIAEICPQAADHIRLVASHLSVQMGGFLFIDYAKPTPYTDTLQAIYKKKYSSPLLHPGHSDLTAHVNFAYLKSLFKPPIQPFLCDQRDFLTLMGLHIRARQILDKASPVYQKKIIQSINRLTGTGDPPHNMGTLFKVLGGMS